MAYVYRHIRLDKNEPFYIGIGKEDDGKYVRAYQKGSSRGNSVIWKRIAKKTDYKVEILLDNLEWKEAGAKEIEFIKLYGRIDRGTGTLANLTDGGDGNLGLVHSEEALKKISEASKNRRGNWICKKMSEESKAKMSLSKKGKTHIGHPMSDKAKADLIKRNIGNKHHLGKKHTEETKKKMSESMKGRIPYNKGIKKIKI